MDQALARRANCQAKWLGGRMLSDPHGLTQLDRDGRPLRRLLSECGTGRAARVVGSDMGRRPELVWWIWPTMALF